MVRRCRRWPRLRAEPGGEEGKQRVGDREKSREEKEESREEKENSKGEKEKSKENKENSRVCRRE